MDNTDRLMRYFAASALLRVQDSLEWQKRFLHGLRVQASLPKDVVIGRVRAKPGNLRLLRKVAR